MSLLHVFLASPPISFWETAAIEAETYVGGNKDA